MAAPHSDSGPLPAAIARAARRGALLALVVFAVLASEGSVGGLLRAGPFSSDLFDAQAHALVDGRLDVDPGVAGIEGFTRDGRTHLYFGLVPSLLRVPVVAVTDRFDGRLTQVSMLIALGVAMWAAARLLWRARARWRGGEPPARWERWTVGAFTASVGLASPLLFLAARPVAYHEAELWGVATALVAVEALLAWWARPDLGRLAWAALAATVAMNTRGSVGSGAVAALALTGALALWCKRVPRRAAWALLAAVVLPLGTYAAVNQARFGHPVRIPFRDQVLSTHDPARQATLEATDGTLFGPEFAPTALVTYLRPDGVRVQRLFPWVTFRESTEVIGDATFDTVDRSASLPVVAPSLLLLAAVGAVALVRCDRRDPRLAATVGTALGLVSTLTIAFIANRYLSDFTPVLVLLAASGVWAGAAWLGRRSRPVRRTAVAALAGLTLAAVLVSSALALQSQRLFILPSPEARHDLVAFQYDVHERLGGGAPPHVRATATLPKGGRRGDVVVLDRCRGLYWSDGTRWWPLELGRVDGRLLSVTLPPSGERTLLRGEGWTVMASTKGAEKVRLAYRAGDREVIGPELNRDLVASEPLLVWLDRTSSELTIRVGGSEALVGWLVDLSGRVSPGPGLRSRAAPTPLCDDLVARLAT